MVFSSDRWSSLVFYPVLEVASGRTHTVDREATLPEAHHTCRGESNVGARVLEPPLPNVRMKTETGKFRTDQCRIPILLTEYNIFRKKKPGKNMGNSANKV